MKKLIITMLLTLTQLFAISYEYDSLNRLTKATYDNGTVLIYTYNDVDNLLSVRSQGIVAPQDTDNDGIPDTKEIELGLNPNKADSDGDGISDLDEVGDIDNPRDTDKDGTIDALDEDSDGDGVSDKIEHEQGTDPRDKNDYYVESTVKLDPLNDIEMPMNAPRRAIDLNIINTTNELTSILTTSGNTDLVVTSDTDPMFIQPVYNAKGHTVIKVTVSANGKSDTEEFTVYVGEKAPVINLNWLPAVYHIILD